MLSNHRNSLLSHLLLIFTLWLPYACAADACDEGDGSSTEISQVILHCEQLVKNTPKDAGSFISLSLSLAKLYQKSGDLDSAEHILDNLLAGSGPSEDQDRIQLLRLRGVVYFQQRRFEDAFNSFEPALTLAIKIKHNGLVALGYNDLAGIYQAYGDLDTSAKLLLKSYEIQIQERNEIAQASILHNLGSLYREKGAYNEAIVSFRKAYTLYSKLGQTLRAALTLSNLGSTFNLNGDSEQAVELLSQAAESLKLLNSFLFLGEVYVSLAEIAVKDKSPEQAQHWLDQSKQTTNLVQSSEENPRYWFVQGQIWEQQNQLDKAKEAFEKVFAQINKNKEYKLQEQLYTAMAELNERIENYRDSSKYWRIYADTLNSQLSLRDIIKSKNIQSTFTFESVPAESERTQMYLIYVLALLALYGMGHAVWVSRRLKRIQHAAARAAAVAPASRQSVKPSIEPAEPASEPVPSLSPPPTVGQEDGSSSQQEGLDPDSIESARHQLVELMHIALQMWEGSTQTGKLELAQQSKIWSVGIDDGRLRARAMERYFGLNTLPQRPRWRSVVRTCNFVLQRCQDKSLYRDDLETKLKQFQDTMKRKAIINSKNASLDDELCRD